MKEFIRKIRHPRWDFAVPFVVAKIPFWVAAQVQMEEIVFMAVRNIQASLPPAAAASKAATAHCIIVSYCQMMAMAQCIGAENLSKIIANVQKS